MNEQPGPASAIGSLVLAKIRSEVPEFEELFGRELHAEGPEMGAFQAMSVFAKWVEGRLEASPEGAGVRQSFCVVEEVASSNYPMARSLVTEFVEALQEDSRAVALMGPETLPRH